MCYRLLFNIAQKPLFPIIEWIAGSVLKSPFLRIRRYRGGIAVSILFTVTRLMLCGQKSYAPQAGYSGYECELSIHLATAYISFAPVRVLRTGAFCFFNFF